MSEMTPLERRYRRLLGWYPAEHRRTYGEEMIGVLLASAPDRERHPRLAESLDLLRGGLQTRLRQFRTGRLDRGWLDALAVYSLAVPAIWIIGVVAATPVGMYRWLVELGPHGPVSLKLAPLAPNVVVLVALGLPLVIAWHGHRRAAAAIALLPAAFFTFAALSPFATPGAAFGASDSLLLVIEAIALAASSGPRRGVRIMKPKTWIVVTLVGLTVAASDALFFTGNAGVQAAVLVSIAAAAAIGFVLTLPPVIARRFLLLLIPAPLGAVAAFSASSQPAIWYAVQIAYFVVLALTVLLAILTCLPGQRSVEHGGKVS